MTCCCCDDEEASLLVNKFGCLGDVDRTAAAEPHCIAERDRSKINANRCIIIFFVVVVY